MSTETKRRIVRYTGTYLKELLGKVGVVDHMQPSGNLLVRFSHGLVALHPDNVVDNVA